MSTYDAIFLGSSLNELVCAAYLAKGGAKVLVLESKGAIGGAAALTEIAPGFRAAVAPAEAGWLPPKVAADLDLQAHGLETKVEPAGMIALSVEGDPIVISSDLEKTRKSIAARSKTDADKWEAFASQMDRLAGFLETLTSVEAVELMNPAAGDVMTLAGHGLRLRRMGKVDMVEMLRVLPMSLRDLLEDWFETDLLRGALSWTGMANLFQGPLAAGTGYTFLHHLAGRELGGFGSRAFPTSERAHLPVVLSAVLKKLGVEIRTNAPATVAVSSDAAPARVSGVTLESGEVIAARVVVSGADPKRAFLKQLAPWNLPPEFVLPITHVKLRGIRATLMLAVDAAPTFRGVTADQVKGTLVHATSLEMLERAFDAAKHGGISENPALEITVPSLHDPSLAPAGKHVVHVAMQYAPYALRKGTWDDATRASLKKHIMDTLETLAPGIGATVVGDKLVTPVELERDYGLTEGHLYGGELTLDQILFMRPVGGWAHYKTPMPGFFLCGDATHPGGAMPGLAAHHAAPRIAKFLR